MSEPEPDREAEQPPPRAKLPTVLLHVAKKTGAAIRVPLPGSDSSAAGAPVVNPPAGDPAHFPAARHHYQVLGEIGRGGMGVVLRAQDTELGREVAIKVLDERYSDQEAVQRRFVEEAQIGGQLQHPGVVPVYELGLLEDGRPFIAMKLVKGRTLSTLLSGRESLSEDRRRFLTIFESICQTVAYAHSKGVIHRDLKPANVMVGAFGEVQVGDWGLAKVLDKSGVESEEDEERPQRSHMTVIETVRSGSGSTGTDSMVGSVMGTPAYMPPEQAMGEIEKIDERSDVFSLGAILCEILTGKPPFVSTASERAVVQAAHGHIDGARERLEACGAHPELKALALECLAPARRVRPRNAGEVARRVHEHMASADERTRAAELAAAEAQVKVAAARRERRLTLGLAATVVVAVLSAGAFLRARNLNRSEQTAELRSRLDSGVEQLLALRGSGQLTEALEVARNTASLVKDSPWAEDEQRERVARLVTETEARVRDEAAQADLEQRNGRMLSTLEELRDRFEFFVDERPAELAAHYAAAFEAYGAPVDLEDPDLFFEVARWSGIATELAAALDSWAGELRETVGWGDPDARLLTFLALDLDPDPGRAEVRNAILENDADKLMTLFTGARERGHSAETHYTVLSALFAHPRFAMTKGPLGLDLSELTTGLYPEDFLMNCVEAHYARQAQRPDEAIPALRAAVALRPGNGRVRFTLAHSLSSMGDLRAAVEHFEAARELGYDPGETNYWTGEALWGLGEFARAAAAMERATAADPEQTEYAVDLEAVRYLAGQSTREQLVSTFEARSKPTKDELIGFAEGLLYHPAASLEDAELALAACRRVKAQGFAGYNLSLHLCKALLALDRVPELMEAVDAWERATRFHGPDQAAIRAGFRARGYHRLGESDLARGELERARQETARLVGETRAGKEAWDKSRLVRLLREAEAELDR